MEPRLFEDERGWFMESLNLEALSGLGIRLPPFVQINHSRTGAGAFRGLHFQAPPRAQSKHVRCLRGALTDIVVDIRRGSPTYGKRFEAELTEENRRALWVPAGFAHGFLALTDCELEYAVFGSGYCKEAEGGIRLEPGRLPPGTSMNLRDASWPALSELVSPFGSETEEVPA